MEWVLVAIIVRLWLSRRSERRERRALERRGRGAGGGRARLARRDDPMREVLLPDGRTVLNVEGSLFAPAAPDEAGWSWAALEGTDDAQLQHTTTVGEVIAGSANAGGGRPGTADGVLVEAVPVILLPTARRRRVVAVDAYATGGRLGHLPPDAVARHGDALVDVVHVEGRPAGVEARILRGADGRLRTELLLPDRFEPTPSG
jgi:hypothetical protein